MLKRFTISIVLSSMLVFASQTDKDFGDGYQRGVLDTLKILKSEVSKDVDGRVLEPKSFVVLLDIGSTPIEEAFYDVILAKRSGYDSFILNKNWVYIDSFNRDADAQAARKIFSDRYKLQLVVVTGTEFSANKLYLPSNDVVVGEYFYKIKQKIEKESESAFKTSKQKYDDALKSLTCDTRIPIEVVKIIGPISDEPTQKTEEHAKGKTKKDKKQTAHKSNATTVKIKPKTAQYTIYALKANVMTPLRKYNIKITDGMSAIDGKNYYKLSGDDGKNYYVIKNEFETMSE